MDVDDTADGSVPRRSSPQLARLPRRELSSKDNKASARFGNQDHGTSPESPVVKFRRTEHRRQGQPMQIWSGLTVPADMARRVPKDARYQVIMRGLNFAFRYQDPSRGNAGSRAGVKTVKFRQTSHKRKGQPPQLWSGLTVPADMAKCVPEDVNYRVVMKGLDIHYTYIDPMDMP